MEQTDSQYARWLAARAARRRAAMQAGAGDRRRPRRRTAAGGRATRASSRPRTAAGGRATRASSQRQQRYLRQLRNRRTQTMPSAWRGKAQLARQRRQPVSRSTRVKDAVANTTGKLLGSSSSSGVSTGKKGGLALLAGAGAGAAALAARKRSKQQSPEPESSMTTESTLDLAGEPRPETEAVEVVATATSDERVAADRSADAEPESSS